MVVPSEILHERARNVVIVTWDDGVVSDYPVPYLRGWCPCAGCQGHSAVRRFLPAVDVSLIGMEEVGAYAVALVFSDGHDSGIYTWDWLRALAPESEPRGLKSGSYEAGRFRG